jgi:hypothetical protein
MMVVCDWEISEARKRDVLDRAHVRGEEPPPEIVAEDMGLHASVDAEVKSMLQGKTFLELDEMQTQVEAQMRSGTAKVVEYWEAVLKRLHIWKAKVPYLRCPCDHVLSKTFHWSVYFISNEVDLSGFHTTHFLLDEMRLYHIIVPLKKDQGAWV